MIFIKENRLSDVTSHLTPNRLFICAYLLYKLINDGEKFMYIKMVFKLTSLNPNDPRSGRHLNIVKEMRKSKTTIANELKTCHIKGKLGNSYLTHVIFLATSSSSQSWPQHWFKLLLWLAKITLTCSMH
jgi:hypothetical protein